MSANGTSTTGPRLTRSQQGVLHAHLVDGDAARYTVGEGIELVGPVEVPRLAAAIERAVAEAPGWDLRLDADGRTSTGPGRSCEVVDLSAQADPWAAARQRAQATLAAGVPLGEEALHRQELLVLSPTRVLWLAVAHHVLTDGYGLVLVVQRALDLYAAGPEAGPSRWAPVADVVAAEQAYEQSPAHERDLAYWLAAEAEAEAAGAVRALWPGGGGHGSGRWGTDVARLDAAADRAGVTWPDLLATAWAVAVARLGGHRDIVLGFPLMNRMGPAALAPTSVVNVLPLHVRVDPTARVADLLDQVGERLRGLRRHGRLRAEELARATGRGDGRSPLTGPEINLKAFAQPTSCADLAVRVHNLAEGPVDDLGVSVYRTGGELHWAARAPGSGADAALATSPSADPRAGGAGVLLGEVLDALTTAGPDDLVGSLAAGAPTRTAPSARDATRVPLAPELWSGVVAAHPDRTALVADGRALTYAALDERVRSITATLAVRAPHGAAVTLELPRGTDAVAALLACLLSGRVAVPVDPAWPDERRLSLRRGVDAALVLDADTLAGLPDDVPAAAPARPITGDDLAYVIHTSGSTGTPKPVAVTHEGLACFLAHHREHTFAPFAGQCLRIAQTLPLEFDGSWDTLQGLFLGHEVHLLDRSTTQDPAATVRAVHASGLQVVDTTPTVLAALVEDGLLTAGHPMRLVSVGGEACPPSLWRRLLAEPGLHVANLYGPTEATVDAVGLTATGGEAGRAAPDDRCVIGSPLSHVSARVLDSHLAPVPHGVVGELYLAGPQLAIGYLGLPGRTAERFVADPWGPPGARLYRTGDLVSVGPDGLLDYHGRQDDQVKIRGYRVEPAEVEAGLRRIPGVRQAAVAARDGRLLAWVVLDPRAGAERTPATLRAAAAAVLPDHLVPAQVLAVDGLTRTATGKLDVAALPTAGATAAPEPTTLTPATAAERALADVLTQVLGLAPGEVRADSDFFALGGDSITAIRVVSALRRAGHASSVGAIFAHRTVAAVAAAAQPLPGDDATRPAPALPSLAATLDPTQLAAVDALVARRARRRATRSQETSR